MSFRTITKVAIIFLGSWLAANAQSGKEPRTHAKAKAKITVQSSEAKPYDQTAGPALMELRLNVTFTGDSPTISPGNVSLSRSSINAGPAVWSSVSTKRSPEIST